MEPKNKKSLQMKDKIEIKITELLNVKDKLVKVRMEKGVFFDEEGEYLVISNSVKKILYRGKHVIQLDAFIHKETVVDMKTCKDPTKPWNFKQDNLNKNFDNKKPMKYSNEWCINRRIYELDFEAEIINETITEEENNLLDFYSDKFLKIGNDEEVEYGEGGFLLICTPLYYNKQLAINLNVKHEVTKQLNKLGEERNDWHEECPVLDIIDPDLNPNYVTPTDMQVFIDDKIKYVKEKEEEDGNDDIDEDLKMKVLENFPESLSLRSQYKWIPTEILINKDMNAKLLGPIHNLPVKNNCDLYSNILKVFEGMLPGFQKLNLLKENEDTTLQVVIKSQKYEIKPGMKYSGKWHIEGKTENIVAGGVYYCNIDKGFQEDKLLYRSAVTPDPEYGEEDLHRVPDYEVEIYDGSAVVFSNILPHRFYELRNETDKTLTRTFLNFFIVDPSCPIQTETGKIEHWKLLKEKKLKNIIIGNILGFLYRSYLSLEVAKEKRKLTREAMKTEESGWGFIHYGNSGDLEFFDAFHEPNNPKKYENIEKE